ncbi:hypothetical protein B0H13DRAFT_1933664, partial [Mycena leptocephala]
MACAIPPDGALACAAIGSADCFEPKSVPQAPVQRSHISIHDCNDISKATGSWSLLSRSCILDFILVEFSERMKHLYCSEVRTRAMRGGQGEDIITELVEKSHNIFRKVAGLVAFLIPVNVAITAVAGIILVTVIAGYTLLTLLPLIHLDCPYRTPLSGGLWRLHQALQNALHQWYSTSSGLPPDQRNETMVEGVFRQAIEPSKDRSTRDQQALIWTVKSLQDQNELEPFIEAIPNVLWAPDRNELEMVGWRTDDRRYIYDEHIHRLITDPDVQLLGKIRDLLDSCGSGLLSPAVSKRRQISCYKAIWALSTLTAPGALISRLYTANMDPDANPYFVSTLAMHTWARLQSAQ